MNKLDHKPNQKTNNEPKHKLTRNYLDTGTFYDSGTLPDNLKVNSDEFENIWKTHPEEYGTVKIYGKELKTPRWQQTYLQNYKFSGIDHKILPLPDTIKKYLDWANTLDMYQNKKQNLNQNLNQKPLFNQVLINWYKDGSHYISSHADDEGQLLHNSPILSISFGTERKFRIRKNKKIIKDIMIKNNDVLVMGGRFQKDYKHEIVKIAGNKGKLVGRRINITFRQFK